MKKFACTMSAVFVLLSGAAQASEKIAFTSNRDWHNNIYIMDVNGKNQRRLTNNQTSDSTPAWSPDGKKIVFGSNQDGNFEIYVMNSDGRKQTRLTNNPATDSEPAWFDPRFARAVEPPGKLKSTWGKIKGYQRNEWIKRPNRIN